MAIVGIFFGSDTGNTENIAKMIQKQLGADVAEVHDIAKSSKEDLEQFNILLLGIPTWYYGEAQCDWDDFFPTLEDIDFSGKKVALLVAATKKTTPSIFVTPWVPCAISSNRTAQPSSVAGLQPAIISKHQKGKPTINISSVWPLTKIVNPS